MAVRLVHVRLISLLLYEFASGDYCRNEDNSSIPFCQSGTISGTKVYINGSSVKTKQELRNRVCVCYLEQTENRTILVNAGKSCNYCGLLMGLGNANFKSNPLDVYTYGWGLIPLNDTKFTMTLGLDGTGDTLNTAFCITIQLNQPDSSVVLNLTCEDLVARPSTAISTSPNVITTTPTMVPDTTKVIIPAAAGGGAGVLVILAIVIVVCCLRKKRKHAEDPIYMKESERSDAIMTDNAAYGIYADTNTNPVPHVQAHCTGDVYAVVNKEGTSNVCPSVEVPRLQVVETGDVYATVNKTTVRDISNIEHSREISAKSRIQTKSDNINVTGDMRPSTDYADITIDNSSV